MPASLNAPPPSTCMRTHRPYADRRIVSMLHLSHPPRLTTGRAQSIERTRDCSATAPYEWRLWSIKPSHLRQPGLAEGCSVERPRRHRDRGSKACPALGHQARKTVTRPKCRTCLSARPLGRYCHTCWLKVTLCAPPPRSSATYHRAVDVKEGAPPPTAPSACQTIAAQQERSYVLLQQRAG